MLIPKPSILFIDAYDSFSNNIIALLETELSVDVRVLKIDAPNLVSDEALRDELQYYDAVVCGPGPGTPLKPEDTGLMRRIWKLEESHLLPVLGICLGFQSLALEFGGKVNKLKQPQHGMIRKINHVGETGQPAMIFDGVGTLEATLYQSLCIDLGQDRIPNEKWENEKWSPNMDCYELLPLAWAEKYHGSGHDQRILVAFQHLTKPFTGLQYHPESICSNMESKKVIRNWFMHALLWNRESRSLPIKSGFSPSGASPTRQSLLDQADALRAARDQLLNGPQRSRGHYDWFLDHMRLTCTYKHRAIDLPDHFTVPDIVEKLQDMQKDQFIFESSNAHTKTAAAGRYSIIGMDIDETFRFEYRASHSQCEVRSPRSQRGFFGLGIHVPLHLYGDIWSFLSDFLEKRRINDGIEDSPFWGGFMGFTTYELGLYKLGVIPRRASGSSKHARPDLCFAYVTRSLVIDHLGKKIYIQHLLQEDVKDKNEWLDQTVSALDDLFHRGSLGATSNGTKLGTDLMTNIISKKAVTLPANKVYEEKVAKCQHYIRKGDSYELCLTDQTFVTLPRVGQAIGSFLTEKNSTVTDQNPAQRAITQQPNVAWSLYRSLRERQPAPFASFIRFGRATLVSSSPERFLKWDSQGKCELRPMKGTVKKSPAVSTLAQANALLQVPKERAENLMILDLARHDLHGICGAGNVTVPRLMVVEEHASVFQMISVVEGQIRPAVDDDIRPYLSPEDMERAERTKYTGIDVLAASLPPGSMTGAPKKRSCELLLEIEGEKERSLYSGVVGYMDVGGRGDFSVTIRSMFRWDDEGVRAGDGPIEEQLETVKGGVLETEVWHIGAGGAVTSLSTAQGEREEMQTKLNGTLGVFGSTAGN